jgi:hypothetical protein
MGVQMSNIKLAVIGSRSITDRDPIFDKLDEYIEIAQNKGHELIIVSGGASGVDSIAAEFARSRGLILIDVLPAWNDRRGNFVRSAGFKRNDIIWEVCDCGVAFWDGKSKGTAHSFDLAKRYKKRLSIIQIGEDSE